VLLAGTTACSGDTGAGRILSDDPGGFSIGSVEVSGEEWTVAIADTPTERSQGLRGISALGDLGGMLFVFDEETNTSFTMANTLMPIDIAFFDASGSLVDLLEMVPCAEDPCPSYRAAASFRYALETESGGFDGMEPLVLDASIAVRE